MNGHKDMLRQLKVSLKEVEKARKIQKTMLNNMIAQLPEDKRKQATKLFKLAEQGKHININEMMDFTGKMSTSDEEKIKGSVQRVNDKKDEVTSK